LLTTRLHRFPQDYSLRKKALPTTFLPSVKTLTENILFFLLAQVFFFKKKKKCCVNLVESRGSLFAILAD
jgi:hypothetical protein